MSRKHLARTAIEGGRYNHNKHERHYSNRYERADSRELIAKVRYSEDFEDYIDPKRDKVYKEFKDRLNPVRRFMESQIGRPWNKIYSEIIERFDTRTTAGRHILFDHILDWVDFWDHTYPSYGLRTYTHTNYFLVDQYGILRKGKRDRSRYWRRKPDPNLKTFDEVKQWANYRKVIQKGDNLYWAFPNNSQTRTCLGGCSDMLSQQKSPTRTFHKVSRDWVIDCKFSAEDRSFWGQVHPHYRADLLNLDPPKCATDEVLGYINLWSPPRTV